MYWIFWCWIASAALIGAVWLVRIVVITLTMRNRKLLSSSSYSGTPKETPRVSVLVAAKDEEDNIEACVSTLLEQDYPNFGVIAIDDRSGDRTPDILARLERGGGGKLRVITIQALRDGWFGKNNAMREGVSASDGEWLLLTDADCRFPSRKAISMAMREVQEQKVDFLTVIPVLDTASAWERVLQPVCALVLILWFLPERVNDPTKKTAYANGAFMLLRRTCYDAIGGHERVRTEVNEDIKMARLAKREGFALRVVENDDLLRSRMYRTPREAWRGWSRIYYGSLGTVRRVTISLLMLGTYSLFPWISLGIAAVWSGCSHEGSTANWNLAAGVWAGVIVLKQIAMSQFYHLVRIERRYSLFYIFAAVAAFGMLWSAMLRVLGLTHTTWRGTSYHGNRRLDAAEPTLAPPPR